MNSKIAEENQLSPDQCSEVSLIEYVRHLVYKNGKFPEHRDLKLGSEQRLLDAVCSQSTISTAIAALEEHLDFESYVAVGLNSERFCRCA